MPLQTQQISIPLGMGLDEKTGQPTAQKLTACGNVRVRKTGAVEARPGYTALSGGASTANVTAGMRLFSCGAELVAITNDFGVTSRAMSYAPEGGPWWRDVATVPEAQVAARVTGLHSQYALGRAVDAVYCKGLYITAAHQSIAGAITRLALTTIDSVTGARTDPQVITTATDSPVRLVAKESSNKVFLFYDNGTAVCGRILDCSTAYGTWGPEVVIATIDYSDRFEAALSTDGALMLAVDDVTAMGGGGVRVLGLNDALMITSTNAGTRSSNGGGITVCGDVNCWWVAYNTTPDGLWLDKFDAGQPLVFGQAVDTDVAPHMQRLGSCMWGTGPALTYTVCFDGGAVRPYILRCTGVSDDFLAISRSQTFHLVGYSTPVVVGDELMMIAAIPRWDWTTDTGSTVKYFNSVRTVSPTTGGQSGAPQSGAFLVGIEPARVAMGISPQAQAHCRVAWQQFAESDSQKLPATLSLVSANRYVAGITLRSDEIDTTLDNCFKPGGHDLFVFDTAPTTVWLPVQINRNACLSGGVPTIYDPSDVVEYGFAWYPSIVKSSEPAGGNLVPAMPYNYAVTYELTNDSGVLQRSAPSFYTHFVDGGGINKTVVLDVPTLPLVRHDDDLEVKICLWRELYDDTTGAPIAPGIFHLVESTPNNPALSAVQFTDAGGTASTLAVLREKRILYTVGGALENIAPPAFRHMCLHANRLWGISADDSETIWFSKLHSYNELPGFNETLTTRVPGADLTALASLDGKLIAFGTESTWAIFGTGPSDTGQGNDLTDPQQISSSVGCIDPRSVVQTPAGVFFQGHDGIYLLGRDMQIKPVGLPIEKTIATVPRITGAACIETEGEVRFTARSTAGTTGYVLVYNYLQDQWHTWSIDNAAGAHNTPFVSSCAALVGGVPTHHMMGDTGVVYRESGYTDPDGGYPDCSLTTPWIHMAGVQGFQRVRRVSVLGEKLSTAYVTVTGYVDYKQVSPWNKSWSSGEVTAFATGTRVQMQIHVPTQKCEALQIKIDMTPAAAGGGLRLHDLCLEIGAKRGQGKVLSAGERK